MMISVRPQASKAQHWDIHAAKTLKKQKQKSQKMLETVLVN